MLSENIKTIRKSKGLSQEELAVKLNVDKQSQNGSREYPFLIQIC